MWCPDRTHFVRAGLLLAAASLLGWSLAAQDDPARSGQWFKGNLHTHTVNSDGDSTPDAVTRWYREHDYNFLSLTDHNYFTETEGLSSVFGARGKFLLLPAEEVTSKHGDSPVHVNAFGLRSLIEPAFEPSLVGTIQANVDRIRDADAVPSVNHPNFRWAMTPDEFRQVSNLKLFEVYNGHPQVNNVGGGGRPGLESMWDTLLTTGREIYGIAVDDAHHFKTLGPQYSNPGRGWVMVRAPELSASALLTALEAGDFYASTGVVLEDVQRSSRGLRLRLPDSGDPLFTTEFIGPGGQVLATSVESDPSYMLSDGQAYVRAVVTDSNGRQAWVQPVFGD